MHIARRRRQAAEFRNNGSEVKSFLLPAPQQTFNFHRRIASTPPRLKGWRKLLLQRRSSNSSLPTPCRKDASGCVLQKASLINVGEVLDPEDGKVWPWEIPRREDGSLLTATFHSPGSIIVPGPSAFSPPPGASQPGTALFEILLQPRFNRLAQKMHRHRE